MTVELTSADDGATIEAHVGDTILLRLQDNPTTGYQWELEEIGAGLVAADFAYEPASEAMGSGGTATWTLRTSAPGTRMVRLKRWRPWEGEPSVLARFAVTVIVS